MFVWTTAILVKPVVLSLYAWMVVTVESDVERFMPECRLKRILLRRW